MSCLCGMIFMWLFTMVRLKVQNSISSWKIFQNWIFLFLLRILSYQTQSKSTLTNNHKFPIHPPSLSPFSTINHLSQNSIIELFFTKLCREALQHTTWHFASVCHEVLWHHYTHFFVSFYHEAPLHYMCHSKCCCRTSFLQIKQNTSTF